MGRFKSQKLIDLQQSDRRLRNEQDNDDSEVSYSEGNETDSDDYQPSGVNRDEEDSEYEESQTKVKTP